MQTEVKQETKKSVGSLGSAKMSGGSMAMIKMVSNVMLSQEVAL